MLELCQDSSMKHRQAHPYYKGFSDKIMITENICIALTVHSVCLIPTTTFSARAGTCHLHLNNKQRDTVTSCSNPVLLSWSSASFPSGIPETTTPQSVPTCTHSPSRGALRTLKPTLAFQALRELKKGRHKCSFYIFCPWRLAQAYFFLMLYMSVFCLYL